MTALTEDDAKTRWCPAARVAPVGEQNLWNRSKLDTGLPGGTDADRHLRMSRCIGSACMAWRWKRADAPPETGYCGLAGRPE